MSRQFRTGNQALVRELNRSIILNQLRGCSLSRADLAVKTGLNKTTVSSLVEELITCHFVKEIGLTASAGGRPGVLLELNPSAGCIIGLEIGVGYLNVVLSDFCASSLWKRQVMFGGSEGQHQTLNRVTALLRQAVRHSEQINTRLLGIGVAIPGLVDVDSGALIYAPNLGWCDVPLGQLLSTKFNVPVYVDNDANAAALAEHYMGVARDENNYVYVAANVGIGVGIVLGGQVFHGASGYAGEAGHVTLDPGGPICHCGNHGCWERFASQSALIERVQRANQAAAVSLGSSPSETPEPLSLQSVLDAAKQGSPVARCALEETGEYLGIGIANLVNTFNPDLIAFGGLLSLAEEFLTPVIQRTVQQRAMPCSREVARFVVSTFKDDACVMGGVAIVMHDILSRPRLDATEPSRQNGLFAARPLRSRSALFAAAEHHLKGGTPLS